MKRVVAACIGAAAGWVLAPVVDLAVRGTLDERTVAGWRAEAAANEAARASRHDGSAAGDRSHGDDAEVTLPGPRPAPEGTDLPTTAGG